ASRVTSYSLVDPTMRKPAPLSSSSARTVIRTSYSGGTMATGSDWKAALRVPPSQPFWCSAVSRSFRSCVHVSAGCPTEQVAGQDGEPCPPHDHTDPDSKDRGAARKRDATEEAQDLIGEARLFPALAAEYFDRAPGQVIAALASGFEHLGSADFC